MRHVIARVLRFAALDLRVWMTGRWVMDLAWGVRVGALVGVVAGVVLLTAL